MSAPRVRPTFALPLAVEPQRFFAGLEGALASGDGVCRGHLFEGGAILRIEPEARRLWSPALYLHIDSGGERGNVLHGKFSPSSPVWTAFVAIYIGLACVAIGGACWGLAQSTLDRPPWAFLLVPLALLLAAFTYGAAFIGQGLGAEDMHELRALVERAAEARVQEPSAPGRPETVSGE
ncbi:MAG: hypothetical protein AAF628_34365 [Planctomycetota bacterium]